MTIIDLSHEISVDTPVYPGTPQVQIAQFASIERDGFAEKQIAMVSHTSTHIDAPAHILTGGKTLDQIDISNFYGSAIVLDARHTPIEQAGLEFFRKTEQNDLPGFLLFYTGWSEKWGSDDYLYDYPTISISLAERIANSTIKAVGIDTISVDALDSKQLPIHHILLASETLIIENLNNLNRCLGFDHYFNFSCMPLKIKDGDGSPVRAVAII